MSFIKQLSISVIFLLFILSCERDSLNTDQPYTARVVGYDYNCGTCILEFPYDSTKIINAVGKSQNNYYEAINLNINNFEIGQQLKCTVRKTSTNELTACITLYPSLNYKSIYIKELININYLVLNDTLTLAYHDCLTDPDKKFYICLDSIVNESRCPLGLECFWAGMATVRFKLQTYQSTPVYFNLSTLNNENKTIISGYTIKLVGLDPYPSKDNKLEQEEYKAKLFITREN
jgi:hypothetical protein